MNSGGEVLPTGIAQGLHEVTGKPKFDAFVWQGLTKLVETSSELGDYGVGHGALLAFSWLFHRFELKH
jgi:hypothetical protein